MYLAFTSPISFPLFKISLSNSEQPDRRSRHSHALGEALFPRNRRDFRTFRWDFFWCLRGGSGSRRVLHAHGARNAGDPKLHSSPSAQRWPCSADGKGKAMSKMPWCVDPSPPTMPALSIKEDDMERRPRDVVAHLVVGTLQEGGIYGNDGLFAGKSQSRCHDHGMLFRNPYVKQTLGDFLLETEQARNRGSSPGREQ